MYLMINIQGYLNISSFSAIFVSFLVSCKFYGPLIRLSKFFTEILALSSVKKGTSINFCPLEQSYEHTS